MTLESGNHLFDQFSGRVCSKYNPHTNRLICLWVHLRVTNQNSDYLLWKFTRSSPEEFTKSRESLMGMWYLLWRNCSSSHMNAVETLIVTSLTLTNAVSTRSCVDSSEEHYLLSQGVVSWQWLKLLTMHLFSVFALSLLLIFLSTCSRKDWKCTVTFQTSVLLSLFPCILSNTGFLYFDVE